MIGNKVKVIIDRPLGTYHPKHKDIFYSVNYGYIEGVIAPEGVEFTKEEIMKAVEFQEKYFKTEIRM